MWTPYNNYLEKLRERQKENPYFKQAMNQQRQLAYPYQKMSEELSHRTHQGYMTEGALADQMLKMNMNINDQQRQLFENAEYKQNERTDKFNQVIDEIQFKKDIFVQQEKEKKKQEKNAWINTGLQFAGAGAGFIAGGMPGASVGSAIGNIAGGIITNSPSNAMQGFQDTLGGLASISNLNQEKEFYNNFSKLDLNNLDRDKLGTLIAIISSGNLDLLENFYNNYNSSNIVNSYQGLTRSKDIHPLLGMPK